MSDPYWSELKYRAVSHFLHDQVRRYGKHLDTEECLAEVWRAYLEAVHTYRNVAGCCSFLTYASIRTEEAIQDMQRRQNERYARESPLSLDACYDGCPETIGQRYFRKSGDFTKQVALWDFARRQGTIQYRILRQLDSGYTDHEIMERDHLPPETYYSLLEDLQAVFRQWQQI